MNITVKRTINFDLLKFSLLIILLTCASAFSNLTFFKIALVVLRIFSFIYIKHEAEQLNRKGYTWGFISLISPIVTSIILSLIDFKFEYSEVRDITETARLNYKKTSTSINGTEQDADFTEHQQQLIDNLKPILANHGFYPNQMEDSENIQNFGLMWVIGSKFLKENVQNLDALTFNQKQEQVGNLVSSSALIIVIILLLLTYL
jgi:hypothetical protein